MKRTDILDTLKTASPALATKDLVPALACFFFDGKRVTAYDDVLGMDAPFPTHFKGGLQGKTLVDFLSASRVLEVDMPAPKDGVLQIKAGRSRLKMPVEPSENFHFAWPDASGLGIEATDDFMRALKSVVVSMGKDPSSPWQNGVTLAVGKGSVAMYSTNNAVVTRVRLKMKTPKSARGAEVVMPPRFVEQIVGLKPPFDVHVAEDHVQASVGIGKSGARRIFSRVESGADVSLRRFDDVVDSVSWDEGMVPIPKGFLDSVARALVVADPANPITTVTVEGGKIKLHTRSAVGEVRDAQKLPKHADAEVRTEPSLLRDSLDGMETMRIHGDKAIALAAPGINRLLATFS